MFVEFVEDGLECEGSAGVGAEGILCGRDDVVGGEVVHHLVVNEGVEEFGDDGQERDRAVVGWFLLLLGLVQFDDFGDLERVRVLVFIDGLVKEVAEDGC